MSGEVPRAGSASAALVVEPNGLYTDAQVAVAFTGGDVAKARRAFAFRRLPGNVWVVAGSVLLAAGGKGPSRRVSVRARSERKAESFQRTGGTSCARLPAPRRLEEAGGRQTNV